MLRKDFYKSKEWVKLAQYIRIKYYYTCQMCGRRGTYVHHKIWLTNENVNNPDIALNEDNLTLLCLDCHNEIHHGTSAIRKDVMFDESGQLKKKPIKNPPIYINKKMI